MVSTVVKADRHPLGPAGRTRTTHNRSKFKAKPHYFAQPQNLGVSTTFSSGYYHGSLGWKPSVIQAILNTDHKQMIRINDTFYSRDLLNKLAPTMRSARRNTKKNQGVLALPAERIPQPGERLLPDGRVEVLEW